MVSREKSKYKIEEKKLEEREREGMFFFFQHSSVYNFEVGFGVGWKCSQSDYRRDVHCKKIVLNDFFFEKTDSLKIQQI